MSIKHYYCQRGVSNVLDEEKY